MKRCWQCKTEWTEKHAPGLRDACEKCLAPFHACHNCRHFREDASQWCGEPSARDERPSNPERGNTCSWFQFADADASGNSASASAEAKQKLATLFGDTPADDTPAEKPAWMRTETDNKPDQIFKPPDPS